MKHKQFRKKRISKKTNLKKGIKRRRYSSKKKYSRSRRLQKGGVRLENAEDLNKLGITDTWSINTDDDFHSFREYIFGSSMHAELWTKLLFECKQRGIPVFVITSGHLIGIVRTAQLLDLSDLIEEVISTHTDKPGINPNPIIDPERHFAGKLKAQAIQQVMTEKGIPCEQPEKVAVLFDDQPHNFIGLCPSVYPILTQSDKKLPPFDCLMAPTVTPAKGSGKPTRELKKLKENKFYQLFKDLRHMSFTTSRPEDTFNYTPFRFLMNALYGITGSKEFEMQPLTPADTQQIEIFRKLRFLFLDWDNTVSLWEGAVNFLNPRYLELLTPHITVTPIS
jgi:hypothetical protein